MVICIIAISSLALLMGLIISSSIVKPIKEIDTVAKEIANEKLDQLITYQS